jgi:hypothetical protein
MRSHGLRRWSDLAPQTLMLGSVSSAPMALATSENCVGLRANPSRRSDENNQNYNQHSLFCAGLAILGRLALIQRLSLTSFSQKTLKLADLVPPFAVAETFTAVVALTDFVVTAKVALALPAGTVTLPGIDATAEAPLAIASETTVF